MALMVFPRECSSLFLEFCVRPFALRFAKIGEIDGSCRDFYPKRRFVDRVGFN